MTTTIVITWWRVWRTLINNFATFQLSVMDLNEKLELVQRLSGQKPTKYGAAGVWQKKKKAAELVAQCLVTAGMIKPIAETGVNTLEEIINSWVLLHTKLKDKTLPEMIRKLIEQAESAQHIYIFCAVLTKHVSIKLYHHLLNSTNQLDY